MFNFIFNEFWNPTMNFFSVVFWIFIILLSYNLFMKMVRFVNNKNRKEGNK